MTENELLSAIATARDELNKSQEQLDHFVYLTNNYIKIINNNKSVKRSLIDTLRSLITAPVVSLTEYRSIVKGLATVNSKIVIFQEELKQAQQEKRQFHSLVIQHKRNLASLEAKTNSLHRVLQFRRPDQVE